MIGMTRQEIEQIFDDRYQNNPETIERWLQGVGRASDCGDDVIEMISKVMGAIGTTVALAAFKDFMVLYNERLEQQIEELVEAKIAERIKG